MKKEKIVFIINGSGGVGKDTFVDYVSNLKKIRNASSINKIKDVANLLGWDGVKDEKGRKFLSDLKKLAVDTMDFSYKWNKQIIEEFFEEFSEDDIHEYLFLHIRETEEIKRLLLLKDELGPIYSVLVENDNVEKIITNESDANVDNMIYDYVIKNNYSLEILSELSFLFVHYVSMGKLGVIDYIGEEN